MISPHNNTVFCKYFVDMLDNFRETMESRMNILKEAKCNILKAQAKQKKDCDKRRNFPQMFQVGAIVLKKDFTRRKRKGGKLDSKWTGPFEITASLGRGLFCLKDCQNPVSVIPRVNGVHLKKYKCPIESQVSTCSFSLVH